MPLLASQPTDVQRLVFLAGQKLVGVCLNKTLQFYGLDGKISHDLTAIKFNDVPIDMSKIIFFLISKNTFLKLLQKILVEPIKVMKFSKT